MKTTLPHYAFILLFILIIGLPSGETCATVRDVPMTYSTIGAALNACQLQDTVMVGPGHYNESIIWPVTQGIKLLSTTGSANTFISGGNGSAIEISGSSTSDSLIVIRGFTIENCSLTDLTQDVMGGGMFVDYTNILIDDVIVQNNSLNGSSNYHVYGAGIWLVDCIATVTNSSFNNNTIINGSWSYGAGFYARSCTLDIDHCHFDNNQIDVGSWSYGAGMYVDYSAVTISNSTISGNNILSGDWTEAAGYFYNSNTILNNCNIEDNTSTSGSWNYTAGLAFENEHYELNDCKILRNRMPVANNPWRWASALYISAEGSITNCLIADNVADSTTNINSGTCAIYIEAPVSVDSIVVSFNHCTIANNSSGPGNIGYGIYLDQSNSTDTLIRLYLNNSILWNYSHGEIKGFSNIHLTNSDIRINPFGGVSMINLNPLFAGANDYHLTLGSPCCNAATIGLNHDLDQNLRPLPAGSNPDMGCYEIDESVSVNELAASKDISIHQVSNNNFVINSNGGKYSVYDLSGKEIQSGMLESRGENYVTINGLINGIYLICALSGTSTASLKFIIIE